VLSNLLTNARESLAEIGEIEVTADVVGADDDGNGRLTITVRDTGRGMTEEFIRNQLFRPFATTKPSGLGVGLSQCRSIVEALGGTIEVESRPGSGTTFWVRMPARVARIAAEGRT
jgi:signal transduction histidine kinase